MEDFIQKQDDALFQEIDNHLIEVYYGRSLKYPSFDKFLIALDRAHQYPTERNRNKFNKLQRLLPFLYTGGVEVFKENGHVIEFSQSQNTKFFEDFYLFDMLPGYMDYQSFNKILNSVISVNYNMYNRITLREYLGISESNTIDIIQPDLVGPKFKKEITKEFIDLLKDYFPDDQQKEFVKLIARGEKPSRKLRFEGAANKLAYSFKQLIESESIVGCTKTELEKWLSENFENKYSGKTQALKITTLNQTISTNVRPYKNPIFEIRKCKETGSIRLIKQ